MAKLKLGTPPKTFKNKVEIPLLEGGTAEITFDFKYRTRKEFGDFVDNFIKEATKEDKPKKKKDADRESVLSDILASEDEANAQYILQVAEGWDLDDPFTEDSIKQLINEFPNSSTIISETYAQALTRGRLKN